MGKGNSAPTSRLQALIGLSGFKNTIEGFPISRDHTFQLELPQSFTAEDIQRMRKDAEGLASLLRNYPDEMQAFVQAVSQGKFGEARKVAQKVGLTEENFVSQGGGLFWVVVFTHFIIVYFLTDPGVAF